MKYLDALRKLERGVPEALSPPTVNTDKTLSTEETEPTKLTQPGFVSSASVRPYTCGTPLPDGVVKPPTAEQETARRQVLAELQANPNVRRTFCNRFEEGNLIITLAIRGIGTGELLIPAERLNSRTLDDYGALLACFELDDR
jgi:hypothetical protein